MRWIPWLVRRSLVSALGSPAAGIKALGRTGALLYCLLVAGCSQGADAVGKVSWLEADSLLQATPILHARASAEAVLEETGRRLTQAKQVWAAGAVDAKDGTVFGRVTDVVAGSGGRVYVLDGMNAAISLFNTNGQFLTTVLRDGDGPLELRSPTGLALHHDTLVVHSRSAVRLLWHEPRGDPAWTLVRGFRSSVSIHGLCVADDGFRLRVATPQEVGSVASTTPSGERLGSFGIAFRGADRYVNATLSAGPMACNVGRDRLAVAFDDGPIIAGYQLRSGVALWTTKLPDFLPPAYELVPVEGTIGSRKPGSLVEDRLLRMITLPPEWLIVQVLRMAPTETVDGLPRRRGERFRTYLLSANTGDGIFLSDSLPEILHATGSRLFARDHTSLTPRLVVLSW